LVKRPWVSSLASCSIAQLAQAPRPLTVSNGKQLQPSCAAIRWVFHRTAFRCRA
jgi:hypothetical protein